MADSEKVIKGLECCSQMAGEACKKCPYANECEEGEGLLAGAAHLAADSLSLLKEQEERLKQEYMRGYEKAWDEIGRR